MQNKRLRVCISLLMLLLIAAGCGGQQSNATITVAPTRAPVQPTSVATAINTLAPPTPAPTSTSSQTPVPSATATSSPIPSATSLPPTATATNPPPSPTRSPTATPQPSPTPGRSGSFGAPVFALGVLNERASIWASDSFPEGVKQIYALFDYRSMRDDQVWRAEWFQDGVRQDQYTTEKTWSGGGTGTFWVRVFNSKGLSPGDWEFRLYLDGKRQQTGYFTVELNGAGEPAFGPITFAGGQKDDSPVDVVPANRPEFAAGTQEVYAFFDAINVPDGATWSRQWFRNDKAETDQVTEDWSGGPNENYWVRFGTTDNTPLAAGVYVLEITIADRLVSAGSFGIAAPPTANAQPTATAGSAPTPQTEPIVFSAGVDDLNTPIDPRPEFPSGVKLVYAIISGKDIPDGTPWRTEWLYDGKVEAALARDLKWDAKDAGSAGKSWLRVFNENGLSVGDWQLNVYFEGRPKLSGRFTVQATPSGQPDFGPVTFAPEKSADGKALNPVSAANPLLPAGPKRVYAFFDGIDVPKGAKLSTQWVRAGQAPNPENVWTWDGPPNDAFWVSCSAACFGKAEGTAFDPGVYELIVQIGGRVATLGTFSVPK